MVSGTATYQELFQGLLAERVILPNDEDSLVPVVKTTGDSIVTQLNTLIPSAYDFIDIIYTGTLISEVLFKLGGSTVAHLTLTYNANEDLRTVTRT